MESSKSPESARRAAEHPFAFLEDFAGFQIALLLRDESPAAAALILSCLPPALSADALAAGGADRVPEIIRRIARLGDISPEVLEQAAAGLREKVRHFRREGGGEPDGMGILTAILRSADASFGDRLLEELEERHPELGRELKNRLRGSAGAVGGIPESFDILEVKDLAELKALGIWVRHRKSGAEVFHILNDDPENLFAFAFATAPEDDTGVAHILEHSVLCGSEHYPLKDAFLVLAQGSLQTFLNAWTFPDKTVYPASSVNEQDYFNLMSVYGDAVFRPLLSEWTFMQEGHREEFSPSPEDGSGKPGGSGGAEGLSLTGVVYNEMKGAFSSLDRYASFWSVRAVMDGTPYVFESGGDPEAIPELTWEGLREFHRRRYSPANCRIFLAGNIPTGRQLAFLDEQFLSVLPPGRAAEPIPPALPRRKPETIRVPCPAGAETKSTVLLSWLCADSTDPVQTMALSCLTEILLGHDGSPLTRTLIESGLGEDLSPASGLEGDLRETVFCAGLRGVAGGAAEVEDLIMGELRRLVREGIPAEETEAALLSMEFAHREIRRAGGPYSLVWLRRSLRGWLHGTKPWDRLLFVPAMTALRRRLAEGGGDSAGNGGGDGGGAGYFESLIKQYLVDNPHRALIVLEPEADFLEKKDAALRGRLAQRAASLGGEERRAIKEKARILEETQGAPETPEALASIPHLSRKDLSPDIDTVPEAFHDAGGLPVLTHETFTNGISYADLAFPLDIFPPETYPWFPLFARVIFSLGLPGMDYGEVSSLLARTAGGQSAMLETGSMVRGSSRAAALPGGIFDLRGRDWLIFRLKALDEKLGPSLDLIRRLIVEADFTDRRRIRDLILEMKNDLDSSLAPAGHIYASGRAGRSFSRSRRTDETWNGLSQIGFIHRIAAMETGAVIEQLTGIRDTLRGAGLIANLTGSAGTLTPSLALLKDRFGGFGPPRPPLAAAELPEEPPGPEVYASPSLQVGFASAALAAAPFDTAGQAAELVLAHHLSTGALWEHIRMKGGAYGAFAHPDHLEGVFSLSTYRDPSPLRSLESFRTILREAPERAFADDGELEKTIIGAYAGETHPRTGAEKGFAGFLRFLYGVEDAHRRRKLERLIGVTAAQVTEALRRLAAGTAPSPVILAGTAAAEQAAKALGVEPRELPS
ncbi:MAG: insulinase family protein [Treponema sp.]|jgi:Zn-dependent M16 (insulinase) family peptidase|nr:insulinase family protein [Treponema sp.]